MKLKKALCIIVVLIATVVFNLILINQIITYENVSLYLIGTGFIMLAAIDALILLLLFKA